MRFAHTYSREPSYEDAWYGAFLHARGYRRMAFLGGVPASDARGADRRRGFEIAMLAGAMLAGAQALCGLMAVGYSSDALPDALRYALTVAVSFTGGLMPAAIMASSTVLARSPQQIGTLQGLYMQGAQLGQFIGTPLIAAVVARSCHWHDALWVTGAAALIGVGLALAARRHEPVV